MGRFGITSVSCIVLSFRLEKFLWNLMINCRYALFYFYIILLKLSKYDISVLCKRLDYLKCCLITCILDFNFVASMKCALVNLTFWQSLQETIKWDVLYWMLSYHQLLWYLFTSCIFPLSMMVLRAGQVSPPSNWMLWPCLLTISKETPAALSSWSPCHWRDHLILHFLLLYRSTIVTDLHSALIFG